MSLLQPRSPAPGAVRNGSPSTGPQRRRRAWAWVLCAAAAVLAGFAARAQQKPDDAPPAAAPDGDPAASAPADDAIEQAIDDAEAEQAAAASGQAPFDESGAELHQVPAAAANAVAQTAPLPGLSLLRLARPGAGGVWSATTPGGKTARLTLNPLLQAQMSKLLSTYTPLGASLVAVDPKTGKVLALVEYSSEGKAEGMAVKPLYPAASVFKIITGAALLEKGVSPDAETCYHGGMHGLVNKLLQDKPRLDRRCLSLSMALAKSANVVFAKMAVKHLDAGSLRAQAEKFLFNRPIWAGPSVESSTAQIPEGGLEFAKSAAGFGNVKLSPLHAALIAAAVGNGGVAPNATLIESIDGVAEVPSGSRRILRPETAKSLTEMMKLTVSQGTATHYFKERRRMVLGDIEVAGKTGSLSSHQRPFKDYSWFVGFAPANDPQIAIAAVVVNGLKWRVHAPYIAREALRVYLLGGQLGQPPAARVKHPRRSPRRR